jgi:hypothetical protein
VSFRVSLDSSFTRASSRSSSVVPPVRADPVGTLEIGEQEDVEQFATRGGAERVQALP